MRPMYPVFDRADWNTFGSGEAWVKVPLTAYRDESAAFDIQVGDVCIVVENEEMMGCFGTVTELHTKTDKHGTPKYVKVRLDS